MNLNYLKNNDYNKNPKIRLKIGQIQLMHQEIKVTSLDLKDFILMNCLEDKQMKKKNNSKKHKKKIFQTKRINKFMKTLIK